MVTSWQNTEGGTLTEKKLDFDKKMHNYVLTKKRKKKKKKENTSQNTALPPTRRQKPTHKIPTAAGMRQCNRSATSKKSSVLRLNERK
jgi:hypothetical protein